VTDHKTLERYVLLAGIFATGEDRAQFEELADDIRALLEENRQLQADKAALISSKIVGPKDLMEENERLRADVAELDRLKAVHETTCRDTSSAIETARKWSTRWKKLAQFRGWPASEHEKTRQENKRLKTSELQSAICSNEAQNCAHKLRDGNRDQQARIDAALAVKMPQPTHENDAEREAYVEGWDDCIGSTVEALQGERS